MRTLQEHVYLEIVEGGVMEQPVLFKQQEVDNCFFSTDRKYRYVLHRSWHDELDYEKPVMWIGLNPSTADEKSDDPTIRKIRFFSQRAGYNSFYMLNLFAFRATSPKDMKKEAEPVGPDNLFYITEFAPLMQGIILCYGNHGKHRSRDVLTVELLKQLPGIPELQCLGKNANGTPKHPLYLRNTTQIMPFL